MFVMRSETLDLGSVLFTVIYDLCKSLIFIRKALKTT